MNDNREYISIGANSQPQQTARVKKKSLLSKLLKLVALVLVLFIAVVFAGVTEEEGIEKDELQQYGTEKYYEIFGSSSAIEDNILLIFLADEELDDYSTMGIVGANVTYYIRVMFEDGEDYYDAVYDNFDYDDFADYLTMGFGNVIGIMTDAITDHGFYSSFNTPSDRSSLSPSGIINQTALTLDESYITDKLEQFTEMTEIPCVLLIEYEQNVYSEFETVFDDIGIALFILMMLLIPATIIVAVITFLNSVGGNLTDSDRPARPRITIGGLTEKCGKDGCDGRVGRDERPPWEYD